MFCPLSSPRSPSEGLDIDRSVAGAGQSDKISAVYSAVAIGIVPFGVLAVSGWLGIVYQYHPVPLRYRWRPRHDSGAMLVRWGILVLLPYAIVPGLTIAFLSPSLLIWGLTSPSGLTAKLPDNDVGLGVGLACLIAVAAVWIGHHVSLRLIARRRDASVAYLTDPLRGCAPRCALWQGLTARWARVGGIRPGPTMA